ncbi:DEAD-box ATP-dependent RNA helicase 56 [Camellia lanceoleosa]|uniref:DEAD-box ATP-dependent RNA helicase 56 n=1 Tax=Camellia lanceoleosa TaxID=1840588 RepID=A0ACC0FTU1_9ERIC|nr:DEAD-box ATP-dependent RNA helicase 56 [Camellia lanceoleosa]
MESLFVVGRVRSSGPFAFSELESCYALESPYSSLDPPVLMRLPSQSFCSIEPKLGTNCRVADLVFFVVLFWSFLFCFSVLLFFSVAIFCRLTRYKGFKEGHKRILVATDLVGRGIDTQVPFRLLYFLTTCRVLLFSLMKRWSEMTLKGGIARNYQQSDGMIRFDVDYGLAQLDKYFHKNDNHVIA